MTASSQRSWVLWITSWLAAIDGGLVWDDLLALLALGLLLLAVDAGSGAPSPLAVVAGWVWADFVEFDEILPDFRLLAFFIFLTQKLLFRANVLSTGIWGSIAAFFGLK